MHILICECWIRFLQVSRAQGFEPCKAWVNPTFSARFHGFFELHVIWIDEINASQLSGIVELQFFSSQMLLIFSSSFF